MSAASLVFAVSMDSIRHVQMSAAAYASAFEPLLSTARAQLSDTGEVQTLEALASLVVSSAEYWEQNFAANFSDVQQTIVQSCGTLEIDVCLAPGGGGPLDAGLKRRAPGMAGPPLLRQVSYENSLLLTPRGCDEEYSGPNIVAKTVIADAGGAFGRVIGVALKIATAGGFWQAAAAASGGMFVGQVGAYLWCVYQE